MKKKTVIKTGLSRKGALYAERKQRQLVTVICGIIALVAFVWACTDPASASSALGYGVSLASMTLIGSIDDVSDRETHGNEIAYQVVLIATNQLLPAAYWGFPQPDAETRLVTLPAVASLFKQGEAAHYFEAHTIPTLLSNTEKGDITTNGTNTFTVIMGGDRLALKNFIEEYSGGKFIILYKHIKSTEWHIIGEPERPMLLGTTETKDDADGRYSTLTFTRQSVYLDSIVKFNGTETIQDLLAGAAA